jgi:hypothetical protein
MAHLGGRRTLPDLIVQIVSALGGKNGCKCSGPAVGRKAFIQHREGTRSGLVLLESEAQVQVLGGQQCASALDFPKRSMGVKIKVGTWWLMRLRLALEEPYLFPPASLTPALSP